MMENVPCMPWEASVERTAYCETYPSSNPSETTVRGFAAAPAGAVYVSAKTDASSTVVVASMGGNQRSLDFLDRARCTLRGPRAGRDPPAAAPRDTVACGARSARQRVGDS